MAKLTMAQANKCTVKFLPSDENNTPKNIKDGLSYLLLNNERLNS